MDHQITFVTFNRSCPWSKPRRVVNHLLLLTEKPSWMEAQAKLNEKCMSFGTLYFKFLKYILLIEEYKIKLVCQFLYFFFLLFFTSHQKLYQQISFLTFTDSMDSPKPTTLLLRVFRWCPLNLENFWFHIWVVVLWLNFTTQMSLRYLLLMPWIKYLTPKTIKYILTCWERSAYM